MARVPRLVAEAEPPGFVRVGAPEFAALRTLLFRRYPHWEWATFARCGWRPTQNGLVLTLASLDPPHAGDLDETVGHVAIDEAYTLRIALTAETHPLGITMIHSHPFGALTIASVVDDDMDRYYARYFQDFAPNRPYTSLIFAERDGTIAASGRVFWQDQWHPVERVIIVPPDVSMNLATDRWTDPEMRAQATADDYADLNDIKPGRLDVRG